MNICKIIITIVEEVGKDLDLEETFHLKGETLEDPKVDFLINIEPLY